MKRLQELGFAEGRNLKAMRTRWDYSAADVRRGARELVAARVDVIVAGGSLPIGAAIDATRTIPIVMLYAGDPIAMGYVRSLSRPGGNVTGMAWDPGMSIAAKTAEIFSQAIPAARAFGVLFHDEDPSHVFYSVEAKAAIERLKLRYVPVPVRPGADVQAALQSATRQRIDGLMVLPDQYTGSIDEAVTRFTQAHKLPLLFTAPPRFGYPEALIVYGPDVSDHAPRAAEYVARILRGADAGALPIEQTSRVSLLVNMKVASALGIRISPDLVSRADEVVR